MSKASEAAMKAFPKRKDGRIRYFNCTDDDIRRLYAMGYRKAEKDLADVAAFSSGPDGFYYGKGYQQGKSDTEKHLGWHSVDESLPSVDEEVIVLTDALNLHCFHKIGFAHIVNQEATVGIDRKPYKPISHEGWNIPAVKYWMPMPKLKEEER